MTYMGHIGASVARPFLRPHRATLMATAAIAMVLAGDGGLVSTPAMAQAAAAGDVFLEEVLVTARRRAESLQNVPISVSAFSDTRLKDLQADDISGIQYAVPNLYLDRGDASNAVIFMRGIGQNDSLAFVESGVAIYIDDVFIARNQAAFLYGHEPRYSIRCRTRGSAAWSARHAVWPQLTRRGD